MKCFISILALLFVSGVAKADNKDSTFYYSLPDSVKAIRFMAEIKITAVNSKKEMFAGIQTDVVKLSLESDKKERAVVFEFPTSAPVMASGLHTDASEKGEIEWNYNWNINDSYKLVIETTSDSAENFSLYSGYIFLPTEKKWKLIGSCKINGRWNTLQSPASFINAKENGMVTSIGEVWVQRNTGSWKNLKNEILPNPIINLYGHLDSTEQRDIDTRIIKVAMANGKTDVKNNVEGVYYAIMKEGTGRQVSVNDTVTVYYKGYLFANDSVFDQTSDKPAVFPLKRLIKGWQIGLPMLKVGGKIKLVIPSDLAYSIRTRAAKIPPNSVLVFEIEVLDAKTP